MDKFEIVYEIDTHMNEVKISFGSNFGNNIRVHIWIIIYRHTLVIFVNWSKISVSVF